jgi:hypothetical protein
LRDTEVGLLAARWQITNIHRLENDLMLTHRSARLIKKLAERAGPKLRIADEKSAYCRVQPGKVEAKTLHASLSELFQTEPSVGSV